MTKSKTIKKDVKKYTALKILSESDGGKILVDTMLKDIVSIVETLSYTIKPLKHEEYIHLAAKMSEKLSIYKSLINAPKNAKLAKEALAEALKEEEDESEE